MNRTAAIALLVGMFVLCGGAAAQTVVPIRLADVRTVYVDEASFRITWSTCGTSAGGYYLPCASHSTQRIQFLEALKRWLAKSGFTVVDIKDDAEGILQGTLSIDDQVNRNGTYGPTGKTGRDPDKLPTLNEVPSEYRQTLFEPHWNVAAWLTNQAGRKIWTLGASYPGISYAGEKAKIEGKKLAKAVQYDLKHHH